MARVKLVLLARWPACRWRCWATSRRAAVPGSARARLVCLVVALIVLPVTTLVRLGHRMPAGIAGRERVLDLTAGGDREAFIGAGKGHALLRLPGNESFRIRLREWEALAGCPNGWTV